MELVQVWNSGTVMGVFMICWLPFFVTNIISGICPTCIQVRRII
jgi:dopamine D1-like receptor